MAKKWIVGVLLSLFLLAGLAISQQKTKITHKKTRTLTGCLEKGDGGDEYKLTTKKGSTWDIKSDSLKLGEHVGHTVKVTGVVANAKLHGMKEDVKGEMKEHGVDKSATEHGHLTATNLRMVSDTCQR